ncbi:5-methyltetrahydropteroyltriglutamate-homocysteine S-methyltransferase, putative [Trypanosoma equiperdum]|uniref:5-methyltetrahydropteroyltriglutamate--homocysteine S-methyltransferase n=1 Tax=Trypanosoma equiperdum TaxID=5694 RepID=A0A1G4IIC1_TRYEQ|nr:5-methyltetrahydropteroyltriglutamate-homocysteine S-methyltransferase, putative [Trypanosoma equiperdum]
MMTTATRRAKIITHTLGFPRFGVQRELKGALESYWSGAVTEDNLRETAREVRFRHWRQQMERGVDMIPVGDFHWYDHVLSTSLMLDNVPPRHRTRNGSINIDTLFRVARGYTSSGKSVDASEMTKWFNTNYHYIVPEFTCPTQTFSFAWNQLIEEVEELLSLWGPSRTKPVILGPVSYVWLGKVKGCEWFDRRSLLPRIVPVYAEVLRKLAKSGIQWVQLDEPALVLDLEQDWLDAFEATYKELRRQAGNVPKLLLTTYFDSVGHNMDVINCLAVDGLHVDAVAGDDDLVEVEKRLPASWVLSAGVIDGRNVWKANLHQIYERLAALRNAAPARALWIGTSCSLLHSPIDVGCEVGMDEEIRNLLAFALQKCDEMNLLADALKTEEGGSHLVEYSSLLHQREVPGGAINEEARKLASELNAKDTERSLPYSKRVEVQRSLIKLPLIPTTTIGSFPRTSEIRNQRLSFKTGLVDEATYKQQMKDNIKHIVAEQEAIGLDVLVHGEPERNDMVEYFAELLSGFVSTANGWIQSYGSRCVKPPIIYGNVSRPTAMTLEWLTYAQSLTQKPVKGILTGPVTILSWSFVREDLPRREVARQVALALREEVDDLQNAGIRLIQVDEPALREGLPLQRRKQQEYLKWATEVFKLVVAVARPEIQIHTHICYSEIHDIAGAIAAMDADVIYFEATRSDMELLRVFDSFTYLNGVGLGVYDVHSPNVPSVETIVQRLEASAERIPLERLWVNPDCGLKTRGWKETGVALRNMVEATRQFRERVKRHFTVH